MKASKPGSGSADKVNMRGGKGKDRDKETERERESNGDRETEISWRQQEEKYATEYRGRTQKSIVKNYIS